MVGAEGNLLLILHIPISDKPVLIVSEPCACSWYPAPSLRVTRKSTGSLGNLYPNFHFWLKSRLTTVLRSEQHLADPLPEGAHRSEYFFILSLYTAGTQNFSWVDSRGRRVSPRALASQANVIYIYVYISQSDR